MTVAPDKPNIYTLRGNVMGTCKSHGRSLPGSLVAYNIRTKIPIKPDGSFSATRRSSGGVKGTLKVRGVFDGTRVTGKLTARQPHTAFGKCRGSGKFRAKGEQIA